MLCPNALTCLTSYLSPWELLGVEEVKNLKFKYNAFHYVMKCDEFNYIFGQFERIKIVGINICAEHKPLCKLLDGVKWVRLKGAFRLRDYRINWENVRVLELMENDSDSQSLSSLGLGRNLRSIELVDLSKILNIDFLGRCTRLRIIKLRELSSLICMSVLKKHFRMRAIDLAFINIDGFDFLNKFVGLRVLAIEGVEINGIEMTDLSFLGGCKELRYLKIFDTFIWDFDVLLKHSEIRVAILKYNSELKNANGLVKCCKLRYLDLSYCHSLCNVEALANCRDLEYVNFDNCYVLSEDVMVKFLSILKKKNEIEIMPSYEEFLSEY